MDYKKYITALVKKLKYAPKILLHCVIMPAEVVSTFFGLGYLPEWQTHWTAFFTLISTIIILYIFGMFTSTAIDLTASLLSVSIMAFIIGGFSIFLVQLEDNRMRDQITIPTAVGQLFIIAISIPAVLKIISFFISIAYGACSSFLYCNTWIYQLLCFTPPFFAIFLIYRIIEIIKLWPISWLENSYNSPVSRMSEALINSLYGSFAIYMINFMFLNLQLLEVINLYKGSFLKMKIEFKEFIEFIGSLLHLR